MKKISHSCDGLTGVFSVPGDKSVSHRALMIGAIANGRTEIHGLLEGEDVLRTADAMRALGAIVEKRRDGAWVVEGRPLREPAEPLYMGNAGTGTRLLAGLVSSYPFATTFTGDPSLSSRPMKRITEPLSLSGATFETNDGKLPMTVRGTGAANQLIEAALAFARERYKSCYLETFGNMTAAQKFYEKHGFRRLDAPIGNTGHFGFDVMYLKDLSID